MRWRRASSSYSSPNPNYSSPQLYFLFGNPRNGRPRRRRRAPGCRRRRAAARWTEAAETQPLSSPPTRRHHVASLRPYGLRACRLRFANPPRAHSDRESRAITRTATDGSARRGGKCTLPAVGCHRKRTRTPSDSLPGNGPDPSSTPRLVKKPKSASPRARCCLTQHTTLPLYYACPCACLCRCGSIACAARRSRPIYRFDAAVGAAWRGRGGRRVGGPRGHGYEHEHHSQ